MHAGIIILIDEDSYIVDDKEGRFCIGLNSCAYRFIQKSERITYKITCKCIVQLIFYISYYCTVGIFRGVNFHGFRGFEANH